MLRYPVKLVRDTNGSILVEVPDIPEAHTFGEDEEESLLQAVDAIETALALYIEERKDIPAPSSAKRGMRLVALPALTEAKLALYSAMRAGKVGKAELARRLNCHLPQIDRLLDLTHDSRLDQMEAAFRALGKRLDIRISEAA
jgi:antitoxin HicB